MNISLVMVTSDGKTKDLPPMRLPITIGRAPESKLRIPVADVSRAHCELLEEDDELIVRDLKSSNGTYVNKERVKTRELLPGDLLCVGPAVLVVRIDGHPKVVDPIISWANGAVAPSEREDASRPTSDGVPQWKDKPKAAAPAKGANQAGDVSKPAGTVPAHQKPLTKMPPMTPADPDDSGDVSKLLADLSESDFDIDFGEDDEPKKSPPPKK